MITTPPPPPLPPTRRLDLPLIGHSYPELMRTPRARWWNPLVSFGVVLVLMTALSVALLVPMGAVLFATVDPQVLAEEALVPDEVLFSAPMTFLNNVLLIAMIGVALLAVAVAHPVAARFVHSVEGRVRWRWLLRCLVTLLPLFLVYVVGTWALDGAPTAPRAEDWVWLLVMALVMTPFQAAGEEYLFRGWVMLALGTWFRRPVVAVVLSTAVSAVVFALAHGSLDPWILLDLGVFAAAAVLLTWRTGGLEAAIALHVVNNVVLLAFGTVTGLATESYVTPETSGDPVGTLVSVAVMALATALLLRQARRAGVARTVPASVGARP